MIAEEEAKEEAARKAIEEEKARKKAKAKEKVRYERCVQRRYAVDVLDVITSKHGGVPAYERTSTVCMLSVRRLVETDAEACFVCHHIEEVRKNKWKHVLRIMASKELVKMEEACFACHRIVLCGTVGLKS